VWCCGDVQVFIRIEPFVPHISSLSSQWSLTNRIRSIPFADVDEINFRLQMADVLFRSVFKFLQLVSQRRNFLSQFLLDVGNLLFVFLLNASNSDSRFLLIFASQPQFELFHVIFLSSLCADARVNLADSTFMRLPVMYRIANDAEDIAVFHFERDCESHDLCVQFSFILFLGDAATQSVRPRLRRSGYELWSKFKMPR